MPLSSYLRKERNDTFMSMVYDVSSVHLNGEASLKIGIRGTYFTLVRQSDGYVYLKNESNTIGRLRANIILGNGLTLDELLNTIDEAPVEDSGNLVYSGGIYSALSRLEEFIDDLMNKSYTQTLIDDETGLPIIDERSGKLLAADDNYSLISSTTPTTLSGVLVGSGKKVTGNDNYLKLLTYLAKTPDESGYIGKSKVDGYINSHGGLGYIPTGSKISLSYEAFIAQVRVGNFSRFKIGDYFSFKLKDLSNDTFTGPTITMEIAGIDTYYGGGSVPVPHHVDFISRELYTTARVFNSTATNNGTAEIPNPLCASALTTFLNDEEAGVFAMLPDALKEIIIEKIGNYETRVGGINEDTGMQEVSVGKLWLPTEVEVNGFPIWSENGYGTSGAGCNKQYPIFKGSTFHLIKKRSTTSRTYPASWWTASPMFNDNTKMCAVSVTGDMTTIDANTNTVGFPICFRVG